MHIRFPSQWAIAIALTGAATIALQCSGPLGAVVFTSLQKTAAAPLWKTITAGELDDGVTLPADTNVIIHLPTDIKPLSRTTLFGGPPSAKIRYWGYCFDNGAPPPPAGTLPGKVFLSEAERTWRAQQSSVAAYSIYSPPTTATLRNHVTLQPIHHQLDMFQPGATCYVMSSVALAVGTDRDADGLNSAMEKRYKTDPNNPDTDGDGVKDGDEVFNLHTNPTLRDTDGDGLVDGIEDKNLNGYHDKGETDPNNKDSDGDGLCDGLCRVTGGIGKLCHDLDGQNCIDVPYARYMGEDKNLNGIYEPKLRETDPLNPDSYGDGIGDEQHYYKCLLDGGKNC